MKSRGLRIPFRALYTLASGWALISAAAGCVGFQPATVYIDPSQASQTETFFPSPTFTPSPQASHTNTPSPSLPPGTASSTPEPATITPTPGAPSPTGTSPAQASTTPSLLPAGCSTSRGAIERSRLDTTLLPGPLIFRVYLPPCYSGRPDQRYPSLYMLHGLTYTDDQWERLGIGDAADTLIATGQIQPLIIVMPLDDDWRQPAESHFGQALVNDLIPWIDAHYATRTDRYGRAIGGLSRGASWAIHLGLKNWKLFASIGAHSLALFWSDSIEVNRMLDDIPWDAYPRIYLDIGTKDEDLASAQNFEDLLMARHFPHEWHLFPGFHDEAYWRSHVVDYLLWYSAQW